MDNRLEKNRKVYDDSYIAEAFKIIEKGIRQEIIFTDKVVFESTGLSDHFDKMLGNLRVDFRVVLIRINADPELCFKRVTTRDGSVHIDISDKDVDEINRRSLAKYLECDYEILNENKTNIDLIEELKLIIK